MIVRPERRPLPPRLRWERPLFAAIFLLAVAVGVLLALAVALGGRMDALWDANRDAKVRGLKSWAVSCQVLAVHGESLEGDPACDDVEVLPYYPGGRLPAPSEP